MAETNEEKAKTEAAEKASAKSKAAQDKAEREEELAKPGRYIVDGNIVDPNGKVIREA